MNIAIDLETDGLRLNDTINFIGLAWRAADVENITKLPTDKSLEVNGISYEYIIYDMNNPEERSICLKVLKLAHARGDSFVFQNGKFDSCRIEYHYGINLPIKHDIMYMNYLLTTVDVLKQVERQKYFDLKQIANRILGVEDWDVGLAEKTSKDINVIEPYLAKDVVYTLACFDKMSSMFERYQIKTYKLTTIAANAYKQMEFNGFPIDMDELNKLQAITQTEYNILESKMQAKYPINYNSSAQLSNLLYKELKLPIIKRTKKGGDSTDAGTIKRLLMEYPDVEILQMLGKHRKLTKKLQFCTQWKDLVYYERDACWLHPNFKLHGTVTGRAACMNPNLQQIPRDKDLKSLFRSPYEDWEMVCCDYSQLELRFAAIVAGVEELKRAYRNDEDVHINMAANIAGCKPEEVTKTQRTNAKPANFGFLYGMQAASFVDFAFDSYGVLFSKVEAVEIRNAYFKAYHELPHYYKTVENELMTNCELISIMSRPYRLNPEALINPFTRPNILRAAINFPVQSAASDYVTCGIIAVAQDEILAPHIKLCCAVHDSLIMLVRKKSLPQAVDRIVMLMENPPLAKSLLRTKIDIPIKVDAEIGPFGKGVSLKEYLQCV